MKSLNYYDTGENYFDIGYPVYLNISTEPLEPHLHAHDFIEIAYVASGEGIHMIEETEYSVKKGDLFFINYNVPHEFRSLNLEKPLVIHNCIFKPEFIDVTMGDCKKFQDVASHLLFRALFPNDTDLNIDVSLISRDTKDIEALYVKMQREFREKEEGYGELLKLYVTELIILILRTMKKTQKMEVKDNNYGNNNEVVSKIMEYLNHNFNQSLKLQELSMMVYLSPSYISKIFRETSGITLTDYIQNIRIEEACRLLKETDKKIVLITEEVGYNDLKYFQQIFKKITGTTPGRYRQIHGRKL